MAAAFFHYETRHGAKSTPGRGVIQTFLIGVFQLFILLAMLVKKPLAPAAFRAACRSTPLDTHVCRMQGGEPVSEHKGPIPLATPLSRQAPPFSP